MPPRGVVRRHLGVTIGEEIAMVTGKKLVQIEVPFPNDFYIKTYTHNCVSTCVCVCVHVGETIVLLQTEFFCETLNPMVVQSNKHRENERQRGAKEVVSHVYLIELQRMRVFVL